MEVMNIAELKTHLSEVITKVNQTGDAVIIGKYGKPIAKIIPFDEPISERKLGFAKHLLTAELADLQAQVDAPNDCETLNGFYL